jgi:hypothetical protein
VQQKRNHHHLAATCQANIAIDVRTNIRDTDAFKPSSTARLHTSRN